MANSGNIAKFITELELRLPIRKKVQTGNWTDTISVPYGSCRDCLDIGSGKEPIRGRIQVYDLVQLVEILGEQSNPTVHGLDCAKQIAAVKPYLEITACDPHLKTVIEECFRGTFQYDEIGKDSLHTQVHDQMLLHITHSADGSKIDARRLSYPIHPLFLEKANFLRENLLGIQSDYREE
jgi:hypothetical protein